MLVSHPGKQDRTTLSTDYIKKQKNTNLSPPSLLECSPSNTIRSRTGLATNPHMVRPTGFSNHERLATLALGRFDTGARSVSAKHGVHAVVSPLVLTHEHAFDLTGDGENVLFPGPVGAVVVGGKADPVNVIIPCFDFEMIVKMAGGNGWHVYI